MRLATSNADALSVLQSWPPGRRRRGVASAIADGIGPAHTCATSALRRSVSWSAKRSRTRTRSALKVVHRALPAEPDGELLVETLRRTLLMRDYVRPAAAARADRPGRPAARGAERVRRAHPPAERPFRLVFELGELVAEDTALTVQVLRLANSAYFGRGQVVTRIADAAARLGTRLLPRSCSRPGLRSPAGFPALAGRIENCSATRRSSRASRPASIRARPGRTTRSRRTRARHRQAAHARACPGQRAHCAGEAAESFRLEHEVEVQNSRRPSRRARRLLGMWGLPSAVIEAVHGHHDLALDIPHSLNAPRAVAIADRLAHAATDDEEMKMRAEPLP